MTSGPMERSAASAGGHVDISFSGAPYLDVARQAATLIFGPVRERRHAVRYWTGMVEPAGAIELSREPGPPFTLVLASAGALRRMLLPPTELTLAEAFIRGDVDIEGDVEAAARLPGEIAERLRSPGHLARLVTLLLRLPRDAHHATPGDERPGASRVAKRLGGRRHSRERDAAAVRRHYDVGNDFYALWLDAERVYSCGYFPDGTDDIHIAQRAKLDLICRKLRLEPGERLLDIGCGWGGLLRHAVRHYGVRALGITLSRTQADYARDRAEAEGLAERCRVDVRDYRDLDGEPAFDKVVSVGMFEHVGRSRLAEYFHAALRHTRPGGLFLNHGIVNLAEARAPDSQGRARRLWRRGGTFINRYVFPDGELVPLASALAAAEGAGFETRDVENLREHYVLTLRHWVRRLEASHAEAVRLAGERLYRIWRLYLAASAHAFDSGQIGIAQMLFARPDAAGRCRIPRTRQDVYAGTPA